MHKEVKISEHDYVDLQTRIRQILGEDEVEIIALRLNKSRSCIVSYSKNGHTFDSELFIGIIYDDALSNGIVLTHTDEFIIVYDEVLEGSYLLDTDLSLEKACELPLIETISCASECSLEDYKSDVKKEYNEYILRQLNTDTL